MKNPYLHVFNQYGPHCDVWIKANRAALERLRTAIDELLKDPADGADAVGMWTYDGEGFNVMLVKSDDEELWKKSGLPYTADWMQGNPTDTMPWDEVTGNAYRNLNMKAAEGLKWQSDEQP